MSFAVTPATNVELMQMFVRPAHDYLGDIVQLCERRKRAANTRIQRLLLIREAAISCPVPAARDEALGWLDQTRDRGRALAGAAIMSLIRSAKLNGHDPYAYLIVRRGFQP